MSEQYRGIATLNSLLRTHIDDFLSIKLKEVGHEDLIPSYGAILSIVYKNGSKVQIKTIYESIPKQKSTLTEMINRLVKLGYLEKHRCCLDKRVSYVEATQKALDLQEDFKRISDELLRKVFNGFTEEEKQLMTTLIIKAIQNFA